MGHPVKRASGQGEADECKHCSREHRKRDGTNERTGWRFGETQHGVWGRNQLGKIKTGQTQRKMREGVETIKQKGMGKKVLYNCN